MDMSKCTRCGKKIGEYGAFNDGMIYCSQRCIDLENELKGIMLAQYQIDAMKRTNIPGMGDDVPIAVNENGGRQSLLEYRYDLMDGSAMAKLAKVLYEGAKKHAPDNWRKISRADHINHALAHIFAFQAGDTQDEHLEHAFCRMMMACSVEE